MFDSYVAFHARTKPKAIAVVTIDGSVTFEQFDRDINCAMVELSGLTAARDEAVSVAVAAPYLEWVLVLALARFGTATASSSDTASKQVIGDGTKRPRDVTLLLDGAAIERLMGGPLKIIPPIRPDLHALERVLQSSGTTGKQKRVGMS